MEVLNLWLQGDAAEVNPRLWDYLYDRHVVDREQPRQDLEPPETEMNRTLPSSSWKPSCAAVFRDASELRTVSERRAGS